MSILLDRTTRILVQGITTTEGRQHTATMLECKSEVVAGVSPGKYGQEVMGVPVYDKVSEAVKKHKIDASVIFVPRNAVLSATTDAINEGIPLVIIITDNIPISDTLKIKDLASKKGTMIIGPGSAGILVPNISKAGIISTEYVLPGMAGVITRSKGKEKHICQSLFKEEIGESTIVSLGGEKIIGTGYIEILKLFEKDDDTQVVVIGGESHGRLEEDAARYIKSSGYSKPVIAYIFGREANPEMATEKEEMFEDANITVVSDIWEIGQIIKESTIEEEEEEEEE